MKLRRPNLPPCPNCDAVAWVSVRPGVASCRWCGYEVKRA